MACGILVPPPGIEPRPTAVKAPSPNHWTTRELPELFFVFLINLFIYFFAALGFRCCTRAFSSCGGRGRLFVVVRGLLIVLASLVAEHRL